MSTITHTEAISLKLDRSLTAWMAAENEGNRGSGQIRTEHLLRGLRLIRRETL